MRYVLLAVLCLFSALGLFVYALSPRPAIVEIPVVIVAVVLTIVSGRLWDRFFGLVP